MSWLARSIANSLNLADGDTNDAVPPPNRDHSTDNIPKSENHQQAVDSSSPSSPSRGVKEDLSELTKTLTGQFWGVASFLAPPSQSELYKPIDYDSKSDSGEAEVEPDPAAGIVGLQTDFAEIGGKFRSGISLLSNNIAVSEITKMASNLLQLGPEEEEEEKGFDVEKGAVGVTEEVVAFVRDITMHPETWLDFPLPEAEDDEDFYLSDAQQEHALAVEQHVPRLVALRIELCPIYMSEARFWEIYFVLLHPRLDKQDAKLLSTAQVVKARASLAQELHNRTKPIEEDRPEKRASESNDSNDSRHEEVVSVPSTANVVQEMSSVESSTFTAVPAPATEKQSVLSTESQVVDKPVVEAGLVTQSNVEKQPVISSEIQIVDKPVVEGGLVTHSNVDKQPVIGSEIQIVYKPVVEGGFATHKNAEKQPVISSEIQIVDKSVVAGGLATHKNVEKTQSVSTSKLDESDEDDCDDWLKEETTESEGVSKTTIPSENEEDVSFSDLED